MLDSNQMIMNIDRLGGDYMDDQQEGDSVMLQTQVIAETKLIELLSPSIIESIEQATHIVVWVRTANLEKKQLGDVIPLMKFKITDQNKKDFDSIKSSLETFYISPESYPAEDKVNCD